MGATLLRPWRCRGCDLRFYAWAAPITYVLPRRCSRKTVAPAPAAMAAVSSSEPLSQTNFSTRRVSPKFTYDPGDFVSPRSRRGSI